MCYRETGNSIYLEQAEKIAAYLINHLELPADKVPYWDFNAPGIPNEPRDASAAAIMASALYELLKYSPANMQTYRLAADNIMKSLTEQYRSTVGQNRGFILLHSTGSKPADSEVDKPLIYADYYYLEALLRSRDVITELGSPVNNSPVADAGIDQTITLPANTVILAGSGMDAGGNIATYSWCKISGPMSCTISSTTAPSPVVSNLVEGTYLFRLTITDNDGAIASDDIMVVVEPAPVTTSKSIKVNVFGGTNPYNNAQWNNWNVSASKTSSALKYSDATTSAIKVVLSASTAIADNGAAYGGTMAPPEVLRHASYSASLRTLTFNGLSTADTYNIELYASRANTGNSSSFTIKGTSVTIVSDNNKANKAFFSNIVPNSSGQIVVSIDKIGSYNYLNGFILTETKTAVSAYPKET